MLNLLVFLRLLWQRSNGRFGSLAPDGSADLLTHSTNHAVCFLLARAVISKKTHDDFDEKNQLYCAGWRSSRDVLTAANWLAQCDTFERRHIGPSASDESSMLEACGVDVRRTTMPVVCKSLSHSTFSCRKKCSSHIRPARALPARG